MVRAEFAGEQAPEMVTQRTVLHFSRNKYHVRFDTEITDEGSFEVNQSGSLGTLLLCGTSGHNRGRAIRCIFQQVGDRLRVCYGLDGIQPLAFTTVPGQNRYLATYRRQIP
jgi:uncharacterized protein (TIGR03067 family)